MRRRSSKKSPLPTLAKSWERTLRSKEASPYTIRNYLRSLTLLSAYLEEHDLPREIGEIDPGDITDWLQTIAAASSSGNAAHHYRNAVAFWAWITRSERMIRPGDNPMLEVPSPKANEIQRPPLTYEQVTAILKACSGRDFLAVRDHAVIRVFADTGIRMGGLLGLHYHPDHLGIDNDGKNDIFLDHSPPLLRLRLKGGRSHLVDLGSKTTVALDRYLRARAGHRHADSPELWLGRSGSLCRRTIQDLLRKRATQAGITERVHAHRFRRSMATWHLEAGGSRDSLKQRAGWSSDQMVNLYISESRQRLAWKESQQLGVADRI